MGASYYFVAIFTSILHRPTIQRIRVISVNLTLMNKYLTPTPINKGTLYVVATPIGNLSDISERQRSVLSQVDQIAAEDTRRTKHLLSHIGLTTPCFSFHEHNERQKLAKIVQLLQQGQSIALVSDAGTPLISDPGFPLVRELRAQNLPIVAVPGPCALVTALSISGLASDRFIFEGFLPAKSHARCGVFTELLQQTATAIFYESSHRILASLQDMAAVFGDDRKLVIARELTKTFETVISGSASEIIKIMQNDPNQCKGEFVVMIEGASKKTSQLSQASKDLAQQLAQHMSTKQAAKITAEFSQQKKNLIYQFLLDESQPSQLSD